MKLTTAFKLSAIAFAVASTSSIHAATANESSQLGPNEWAGAVDGANYQYVDLGSKVNEPVVTDTPVDNRVLSQLFETESGDYVLNVGDKYYAVTVNKTTNATTGIEHLEVSDLQEDASLAATVADLKPILGGLAQYSETSETVSEEVKIVDSNFLQYGATEKEQNKVATSAGNLTDDVDGGPALTGNIESSENVEEGKILSEQTITVGNIDATTGQEFTGEVNYGVEIKKVAEGEEDKVTTLTLDGLTTTGKVDAAEITVNGKDVATQEALNAEIADRKKSDEGLMTNIKAEAATREQADKALQANIDAEAATREANDAVILETARTELAAGDAATLTAAKAEDVKTLASANAYTDAQVGSFNTQITNVNTRVDQLNKRVNEVEEVANRGVAIALAATQQIPNIVPGQVAVFGGVGHYEGESAAALGLATVFGDGRTSLSAALGVAGGSEVGGRVGVAYVFGGK